MRFGKVSLAVIAAASLISAPVAANAVNASKSVSAAQSKRVGATSNDESKFGGRGSGVIVGLLAAALIIAGIVVAAGNKSDGPTSP